VTENPAFPWQPGTATAIGSLPGTDPLEAARLIATELEDFPHLPELPARGPGADMIGRTAALLIDIPVETTTGGWRLSPERPGRDARRARSLLAQDLDALEEAFDGYTGLLKLQLAGPWTLAAALEQPHSLKVALADPGAVADLASSLAEGGAAHVAEVARRIPGATLVVQYDEPGLPAVIDGAVPSPSGLTRVRAVEEEVLRDRLRLVLSASGRYTVVHCCGQPFPFQLARGSGASAVSFDLALIRAEGWDQLAETAEAGLGLFAGVSVAPDLASRPPGRRAAGPPPAPGDTPAAMARSVSGAWRRMGLPPSDCAPQVVITPACGLAGASPQGAAEALKHVAKAARILPEIMEERSLWS
jgi:hypothetical protein